MRIKPRGSFRVLVGESSTPGGISAPTALNPTLTTIVENSPAVFVPFSDIFSVVDDPSCLLLVVTGSTPTGVTIDNNLKLVVIDPSETGELSAEAIVLTGTNSGGAVDSTLTITIQADASATAPVIGTLTATNKDPNTGIRFYNISPQTDGTPPIVYTMSPSVLKVEIVNNEDGTYTRNALTAGQPLPSATTQWTLDDVDISGATGATIDAQTAELAGVLKCKVTATNSEGSAELTSSGIAINYDPASIVNPVHLGTTIGGTNSGTSYALTTSAYSTGDLVTLSVRIGQGSLSGHSNDIVPPATGPDGETLNVVQAHFDNVTAGDDISMAVYYYIAAADRAAGASISFGYDIVEQIVVSASVFNAGTFNPTTPISDATPAWSETSVATASSGALTATNAGGMVITAIAAFADNITGTPAGWTPLVTALDVGALTGYVGKRDAYTTAAESVAAASFTLAGDGAAWVSTTFVVNPYTGA